MNEPRKWMVVALRGRHVLVEYVHSSDIYVERCQGERGDLGMLATILNRRNEPE